MPASGAISSAFNPLEIPLEIGKAPFKAAGMGIMALVSRSMAAKGRETIIKESAKKGRLIIFKSK